MEPLDGVTDRLPAWSRAARQALRPTGGRLFRKYATFFAALVVSALVVSGAIHLFYSYRENEQALVEIQREKAAGAATVIGQFIRDIQGQVGWTTHAAYGSGAGGADQRRFDFFRLLRQVPAITDLSYLDATGHEELRVSRLTADAVASHADLSHEPKFIEARAKRLYTGPVYFHKDSEPYMTLAVSGTGRSSGVTVAEVNLKFILDVISGIQIGKTGRAYVADADGRLIAHPDLSLVLRKTDVSALPQVRAAREKLRSAGTALTEEPSIGRDPEFRDVLTANAAIPSLGWIVFVDLPVKEAFAPVYASIWRTIWLIALGSGLATLAGLYLARRMTMPIQALRQGAAFIGGGDLGRRIEVKTGDELEALAGEFNSMAERLQESYATLEQKVADRTQALTAALERQTATSDVLGVISRSPSQLQPVLDAIVQTARRLCQAERATIWRLREDQFQLVATTNLDPEFTNYLSQHPIASDRTSLAGRAVLERRVIHMADVREGAEISTQDQIWVGNSRTMLCVPLMREKEAIGVISVDRTEVRPFDDKQIELVSTFADQAVIAIENVRLFEEVQARTSELTEALEYQTAMSDVLNVISRSPHELQPTMDTIVHTSCLLCEVDRTVIYKLEDGKYHPFAHHGVDPAFIKQVSDNPILPGCNSAVGRVALEKRTIHIPDILADPEYTYLKDREIPRGRTLVAVPLLRNGEPIGVIVLGRNIVRPFTDRQIELVTTFADQAVIAIENVRLFEEVQARTRELARSVEELRALGRVSQTVNSSLDLETVLSTILAHACQMSDSGGGAIYVFDETNDEYVLEAGHNMSEELVAAVRAQRLHRGTPVVGECVERRATVQVPDLALASGHPLFDVLRRGGIKALLAVPLLHRDKAIGALLVRRKSIGAFAPETVRLLQNFATQSSLAIYNARLFREIEQKSREIELASQHKSQFLANMSHELRTPLNAVLGYTELIQDGTYGDPTDKMRTVLERVQANGKHLLGLINEVLDLSKIEAGQLKLSITDYSLRDVVQTVVSSAEPLASEKRLALSVELPKDLPTGRGDERRIAQVLLNLVGNAIKFTDKGKVTLAIARHDGLFQIAVSDTGPGIPVAERDRIFEEFHQVDNSSTRKKGGTGLGLTITKRIIELHKGRIWVESEMGNGSTFHIVLPVRVDEIKEAA
jgi:signal transduction histidine kinase